MVDRVLVRLVIGVLAVSTIWLGPIEGFRHAAQAATCATPSVTRVSPNWGGMASGLAPVTITGCGFTGATSVNFFSGYGGSAFTVIDDNTIVTGAPAHQYGLGGTRQGLGALEDVRVTTPAGTSPITDADEFYWFWEGTPCSTASLSGALGSGSTIILTGTTFSCVHPEYRFWIQPPGGSWRVLQNYTAANDMVGTYTWTIPNGTTGTYRFEVDVRDAWRTSVPYDKVAYLTWTAGGCIAAGISASPESPSNPGTTVVLSATSSCPGTPAYRFWMRPPGGAWTIVQGYSTTSTFSWSTSGVKLGIYGIEVDVRNLGSTASYEQVSVSSYRIGIPCTTPTLLVQPSPAPTGSTVTFSASTTGCASPVYRFWTQRVGGPWVMVRDYGPGSTFDWTAPGTGVAGDYEIEADVRDASANVAYDSLARYSLRLMGCLFVNLSATSLQPVPFPGNGMQVTLTANANCEATATYRFWVRAPGGSWRIVQDYSTMNTFVWPVSFSSGTYGLEVDVRNQSATGPYEAVATMSYAT